MSLRECACPVPAPKPQKPTVCVKCGYSLDTEWACNGKTLDRFLERMDGIIPTDERTQSAWQMFRLHITAREAAGRKQFGQSFLGKNMTAEGREEESDSGMYAFMKSLQRLRAGQDQHMDLIMEWAYHSFMAYYTTLRLDAREQGFSTGLVGDDSVHDVTQADQLKHKHRGVPA